MKICLVCSHGGHLTEMLQIIEAFEGHNFFFVTYDNPRTRQLEYQKYLLKNIGINPLKMIVALFQFIKIFSKEKPDIIISTGAEIAIPAFCVAKLFQIKSIYIESWCRVKTPSGTGKLVYHIVDQFFVQWPYLLEKYGKKAKFVGAVID